jgi:hypothetical protein
LTRVDTGTASSSSARHGRSSASPPGRPTSSQASWSAGSRITGIRLWIGASSAFAAVVTMVQVSSGPSGPRQTSHKPAKAKGARSRRWISIDCLRPPSTLRHS